MILSCLVSFFYVLLCFVVFSCLSYLLVYSFVLSLVVVVLFCLGLFCLSCLVLPCHVLLLSSCCFVLSCLVAVLSLSRRLLVWSGDIWSCLGCVMPGDESLCKAAKKLLKKFKQLLTIEEKFPSEGEAHKARGSVPQKEKVFILFNFCFWSLGFSSLDLILILVFVSSYFCKRQMRKKEQTALHSIQKRIKKSKRNYRKCMFFV